MQQVLVLNASYEPLNVTTVRRAHVLVFKGKAEVIEELQQGLRSATDTFPWPHVIRLVSYVRVPRAVQRKISRRALFARDGWRCAYCGTTAGRLTLDHVVPRSRGGESVWENVVTACAPCNHRKGTGCSRRRAWSSTTCRSRRPPCCSSASPRRRSPRLAAVPRQLGLGHRRRLASNTVLLAALERQVALLPLAPRAWIELPLASREVEAMEHDGRRDAGAAVGDELTVG